MAEGLVEALAGVPVARALVVRAREGRDVLPDALRARGAEVDVSRSTRRSPSRSTTRRARPPRRRLRDVHLRFDRALLPRAPAGALDGPRIASIGPATSAALREAGAEPRLEADPHTPDGLVDALLADAA